MLHLPRRYRLPQADRLAQRADVHEKIVQRPLDIDLLADAGELDAEVHSIGRRTVGRILHLQRLDEADVQLACRFVLEQPQEPLAVAIEPADRLFLPLAPLVAAAEILKHLPAVAEQGFVGRIAAGQHAVGVAVAHGVGHAVPLGANGVGIHLGKDPRAGTDLPQLDLIDVGEGRCARIDQRPAIGRARVDHARQVRPYSGAVAEASYFRHIDHVLEHVAPVFGQFQAVEGLTHRREEMRVRFVHGRFLLATTSTRGT